METELNRTQGDSRYLRRVRFGFVAPLKVRVSAAIRRQLWRPRHSPPTTGFQPGDLSILSRRTVLLPAYS
jgi:hypothetical protein